MSTALVTHTFLDEPHHYDRVVRWMKHHLGIYPGIDIIAIDNGSSGKALADLSLAFHADERIGFRLQSPKITRDGLLGYGYTWRAFYEFGKLPEEYDRLIFMESDFFVCSERLRDWTLMQTGLTTVACPKYGFPESALMILTRGCEPYERFVAEMPWEQRVGMLIENALPFTHVDHGFRGDRYEDGPPPAGCDFAAQLRLEDAVPWSS